MWNGVEKMKIRNVLCIMVAALMAGCGEGSSTPQVTTAEGLWIGTTSTLRKISGLVLDDGTYWIFYSGGPGRFSFTDGFIHGTSTSRAGSFSSSDGRDFNFAQPDVGILTVSASFQAAQSLNGLFSYPAQGVSFTSTYSAAYAQTPSLNAIAGTYDSGLTINPSGVMIGKFSGGCRLEGTLTPRKKGNVFDLVITQACVPGIATASGIGYYNADTKTLYNAALAGSGVPFMLVDVKQ
jgi:hypothetical protein